MSDDPNPVAGLLPVEEATRRLLALVTPLPTENIPLRDANGRYLAQPVLAQRDQPPFDASSMDGYAVAGDPAEGSSFVVIGEAGAGHAFTGPVGSGEAVRIFTGAPLPAGTNRVIMQENVRREGDRITLTSRNPRTNIRKRGDDFALGSSLSPRRLRPVDLALLAAMNCPQIITHRRPSVAIIATGDELVWPGDAPAADQIIASNGFALKALAESAGAEARLLPIARDRAEALEAILSLARDADVILTIGGASVGDHDLVGPVTARMGMAPAFWKIALRPGKPLIAGRLGSSILLGLPGNPVSSIVCAELFLKPVLLALQGDNDPLPKPRQTRLASPIAANGPRAHYMRARLTPGGDITPFDEQDSALLSILADADALLIRPVDDPARPAGDLVSYLPL